MGTSQIVSFRNHTFSITVKPGISPRIRVLLRSVGSERTDSHDVMFSDGAKSRVYATNVNTAPTATKTKSGDSGRDLLGVSEWL